MSRRGVAVLVVVAAVLGGCHPYKVASSHERVSGLSAYPSVVIEVALAPNIATEASDLDAFTTELEERVRDTKVNQEVRHAPAEAALALRVRITRLEHKESWSIQNGTSEWYEITVDVDIYDVGRASSMDHFTVDAGPRELFVLPNEPKRTAAGRVYSHAARAIAGQLKKRR